MGVLGLWQLLQPTARSAKIEGLEGKILAIDISIWLYQASRGAKSSSNGHITVLYNRICKLLYYKIKPIFVFDGPNVPGFKQRVLQERRSKQNVAVNKNKSLENRIKQNMLKSINSQKQATTDNVVETDVSQKTNRSNRFEKDNNIDDMFILPETDILESDEQSNQDTIESDENYSDHFENDNSERYNFNYDEIDKEVFESLPDDIKFEIYSEHRAKLKESKKQSFCEFPQKSEDFSDYQLKLLFQKGKILNKIADLKKSITSSYSDGTGFDDIYHGKVASSADQEVILLKKKKSNSSLFSFGKNVEPEVEEDQPKIEQDDNYLECLNLLEKNKKTTNKESHNNDNDDQQNIMTINDQNPNSNNTQNYSYKENKNSQDSSILLCESDDKKEIIDNKDSIMVEVASNKENPSEIFKKIPILSETTKLMSALKNNASVDNVESRNDAPLLIELDSMQSKDKVEISPDQAASSDSDSDDDFVEVKINPEKLIIEDVKEKLKERTNDVQIIDIDELECISDALESVSQMVDSEPNVIDDDETNSELFHQIAGLVQENQAQPQVDYSALSSNRLEAHVIEDAKYLLRMFGLPYVESPGEAEAQCAYLDYKNVTEGSITEDSDTWLFGGKRVYKSFFGSEPCIDVYSNDVIKSLLGLDRYDLINIALLVGSDYTVGVENVGVVKAIEILNEFKGSGIEKLKNFKEWNLKQKENRDPRLTKIRLALSKLNIPESFPSELVFNAYLNPDVDRTNREFTWSLPELDLLRKYMANKVGWANKKVDDDLLPIIKRIQEKMVQKTIENFFTYERIPTFSKHSKRMKSAISSFKNKRAKTSSGLDEESSKSSNDNDFVLSEESDNDAKPTTSKNIKKSDEDKAKTSKQKIKKSKKKAKK